MALSNWRASALYGAGATVALCLSGLKAAVDAEVAANPSTHLWTVADYSAPNGTLVLKPSVNAASGVGARRVMFFGGQVPNTAAIGGQTADVGWLYCGVAPTANVDAPQQSYTVGAPFTTGVWVAGGMVCNPAVAPALANVQYFELDQGIVLSLQTALFNATQSQRTAMVGQLAVSLDGATLYDFANGSGGRWNSSPENMHTGLHESDCGTFPDSNPVQAVAAGYAACRYNDPIDGVVVCTRVQTLSANYTPAQHQTDALRTSGSSRYFLPIPMMQVILPRLKMKMRQMAIGVEGIHAETMSSVAGVQAIKLGERGDTQGQGPWLTNLQA